MARGLVPLGGVASPKLRQGHRGRLTTVNHVREWAKTGRDRTRPLIWFHAPSMGEGLQAAAILEEVRRRQPDWQFAYTFFSPSAEDFAATLPVDVAGYLPYDLRADVDAFLSALEPTALVFAKLDLWPELACRAAGAGCAVMLAAGTVRAGSGRLRWPVRSLLAPGYRSIAAAAAISGDDAGRLTRLGVDPAAITVTGDPRFDSVCRRVESTATDDPLLQLGVGATTMIAGSTWPEDEDVVLEAFARVRQRYPETRLILAPHEPNRRHLRHIEGAAVRMGLPAPVRLADVEGSAPMVVVDRVGVLPAVYGAGHMAYVGGAMGSNGIHSVLEPAAWGIPVTFGPNWGHSRDAGLLLAAGGATALEARSAVDGLTATWLGWLEDDATRRAQGERARRVVEEGLGAAERTADFIEESLRNHRAFDRYRSGG